MRKIDEKFMQKTVVVWLGALASCFLWGSAFPCVKLGYAWLQIGSSDTWTQILFAGCRFTLAGILTILLGSLLQGKLLVLSIQAIPKVLKLSLFQTIIQYLLFYIGLAKTAGTKASIIEGTNVFVAILIASLIFHQEKLTARKMIGCLVGFVGVVLVNLTGKHPDMSMTFTGEGFVFLSTISYAISSVLIKRYSKEENAVMLSGWQFLLGGLIMMVCGYVPGGRIGEFDAKSAGVLLYLAFVSAIAYTVWSLLLTYNPISKVAVFGFMNPIFGFILSAILLKEAAAVSMRTMIALGLVCVGIYIVNSMRKKGIIFDLDGTLWDTVEPVVAAWNAVLVAHPECKCQLTEQDVEGFMGKRIEEISELMLPHMEPEERVAIMEECCEKERVYLAQNGGILYPNLIEVLEKLSEKYTLYIVSNCQDGYIQAFFEAHDTQKYFADIEMSGRTGKSKAENISIIIERNHLDKAIYIGDTIMDFMAAQGAGVPFIFAEYGFGAVEQAEWKIASPSEIWSALNHMHF